MTRFQTVVTVKTYDTEVDKRQNERELDKRKMLLQRSNRKTQEVSYGRYSNIAR